MPRFTREQLIFALFTAGIVAGLAVVRLCFLY
jgi:hypothetical protein